MARRGTPPARRCIAEQNRGRNDHGAGRHRHHRLRQYQRRLSQGGEGLSRSSTSGRSPTSTRRPPRRAARSSACRRSSVDDLLADPAIEIVVNLTVPQGACRGRPRRRSPSRQARPFGEAARRSTVAEARQARRGGRRRKGLRIGCAPDTFLGGAHQTCRKLIDEGAIGQPLAGTAFFMCPGHERWHPEPGLLLLRRRRPDARHGPLLHHRPRQPARPGRRGSPGSPTRARVRAPDHQRAAAGHARSRSRSRPMSPGRSNSSRGAGGHHGHELRRRRATATGRSSSTAPTAR